MPFFYDGTLLVSLAGATIGTFTTERLHRVESWDEAVCAFFPPDNNPTLLFTGTKDECQKAFSYILHVIQDGRTVIFHDSVTASATGPISTIRGL